MNGRDDDGGVKGQRSKVIQAAEEKQKRGRAKISVAGRFFSRRRSLGQILQKLVDPIFALKTAADCVASQDTGKATQNLLTTQNQACT